MRLSFLGLTLGLLAGGVGCGDSVNNTPDAAGFKGYDADEGGEVRIEYIKFAAGVTGAGQPASIGTRIVAYLYKTAGSKKFFPFVALTGCTNMMLPNPINWPMATNPLAERTYLDPGTITVEGGGTSPTTPLTLPRKTDMGPDFLARQHSPNKWFFYLNPSDGTQYLSAQHAHTVKFSGSSELPAQTFKDAFYMPADFQLTTPDAGPVSLKAGTALTLNWTTPDTGAAAPPPGTTVVSLAAFTGADGPVVICVQAPNTGSITVPANMVDVVRAKYPAGGVIARQTFTHVPKELVDNNGPTGRRIDFITTWCNAGLFTVN